MKINLKKALIFGTTLIFVVILALVYSNRAHKPFLFQGPADKLTIGVVGDTSFLPLYAQERGFFVANGLDIEIKRYNVGAQALEELIAGNVDVAVGSEYVGTLNSFEDDSFRIVAEIAKTSAYEIVGRADFGLQDPVDIKGKRFGVTRGTAGDYLLGVFLRSNGLTLSDIEVVYLRPAEIQDALINGDIAAGLNLEPYTSNVKNALIGNFVSWRGERGQGIYTLLYVSQSIIDRKQAAVSRLVESVIQAEDDFNQNTEDGLNFLQTYFDYSDVYMREVVIPKYNFHTELSEALVLTMEDQARWMMESGLIEETQVPNYLDLIYFWPLDSTKPSVVTIIH